MYRRSDLPVSLSYSLQYLDGDSPNRWVNRGLRKGDKRPTSLLERSLRTRGPLLGAFEPRGSVLIDELRRGDLLPKRCHTRRAVPVDHTKHLQNNTTARRRSIAKREHP